MFKSKTILIIEDEVYIREIYEYVLKQQFTVITATDGEYGLIEAQKKPDLILLDIMIPKLNGIEVLKRLKADPVTKNIPVVLITNLAEKSIIQDAFAIGAQGYLLKVRFDPHEIAENIKKYLENPTYTMDLTSVL